MRHEAPQLTLPGLAIEERTRVVEVAGHELAATLEAERARGWTCVAMDMAGLSRWRITLEREVAGSLEPIGSKPATESQARPHAAVVENVTDRLQGESDNNCCQTINQIPSPPRPGPAESRRLLRAPNTGYLRPPPFQHETHVKKHCPLVH